MKLGIPSPPRAVKLQQLPGALRRVGVTAAVAALLTGFAFGAVRWAERPLAAQRAFLNGAVELSAQVADVALPKFEERESVPAKLRVIFSFDGKERSAHPVPMHAIAAEALYRGAKVNVLVDPSAPTRVQEAAYARAQAGLTWLGSLVLGLGALLAAGLGGFVLRREVARELTPLRLGALVWLTPNEALPETRDEVRFTGHYFREDVKHEVTARIRPGRRPVRNGEKVLAAVMPGQTWPARVVDEDLAQTLGWYR